MADYTMSDYQNVSDQIFAGMDKALGTAAVIAWGKNGTDSRINQAKTSEAASDAYDALVNSPGQLWYIALYDSAKSATPNGRVDETYLGGVNQETTIKTVEKTTVKTSAGWGYVAGFFGALLGFAALSKKKKRV